MSNKRGNRGRPKKFAVQLKVRDEEQMERTLNLLGVKKDKPCVNDFIERIAERMEDEKHAEMIAMARSWARGIKGWPSHAMIYDCMGESDYPGWDDDEGYDPYEEILDGIGNSRSKKLKKLNKKLFKSEKTKYKNLKRYGSEDDDFWNNRGTMFTNGEWSDDLDDEDNHEDAYKCIKFYSDIENEMSVQEFYSLKEFNDFCTEKGYIISTTDFNNLANWSVVHCCLDPISLEYGENEVITDNSYGALYWTVSEDLNKHEDVNSSVDARTYTD